MCPCQQPDCPPDIPVPPPAPLPPCPQGEPCDEVQDAACVVYTNEPLPSVNVQTNDRLNDIIRKWALGVLGATQAVSVQPSATATLQGNGTVIAPLQAHVRISGHGSNLLKVVDYAEGNVQYNGLEVKLTLDVVSWLLLQIENNEALKEQFCNLIASCVATSCNIASNLSVEPA